MLALLHTTVAAQSKQQYDVVLGKVQQSQVTPVDRIDQLNLATDGKSVVYTTAGAREQGICVLSYPEGKRLHKFPNETDQPLGMVAFSQDGKRVIGVQPGIRVWDLKTEKVLLSVDWDWMKGRADPRIPVDPLWPVMLPVFNPDRSQVYVGGPGEVITLWDTTTGKELARSPRLGRRVRSMAVSPDGKYLAIGFREGFQVRDAATLKEIFAKRLPVEVGSDESNTYRVSFPPEGKRVFVIGRSGAGKFGPVEALEIWDFSKNEQEAVQVAQIPVGSSSFERVVVLPGGQYGLVIGGYGAMTNVIDLKANRVLGKIFVVGRSCHPLILTPDEKVLLTGTQEASLGSIKVEDVMTLIVSPLRKVCPVFGLKGVGEFGPDDRYR
jgi:WD40 repeat protein